MPLMLTHIIPSAIQAGQCLQLCICWGGACQWLVDPALTLVRCSCHSIRVGLMQVWTIAADQLLQ